MGEKKGTKEIIEVLEGMKSVALFGKKVGADGKVDLKDIPALVELAQNSKSISDAVENLNEVPSEIKDLDGEEAKAILAKLLEVLASIKAA